MKLEKTLKGDIDAINGKINTALMINVPLITKRDSWTTTVGEVKCVFNVYEKHAKRVWNGSDWQDQPHFTLSVLLIDTGDEVRICGITGGSAHDMYFNPDSGGEYELFEALSIILEMFDQIIL